MTDLQSIVRLQTWLSPAFPTGAFSYSHGLEAATQAQRVQDQESLHEWLRASLEHGAGWNDAVLLAATWRQAKKGRTVSYMVDLAQAMCISRERYLETTAQGSSFLKAAEPWGEIPTLPEACPLPVAVGCVSATHKLNLTETLAAYLHAYVSNQVQAALRLMKLGQQGGVEILAELEPLIIKTAQASGNSSLDDLGSNTFMADICAMQHETLEIRIFRS